MKDVTGKTEERVLSRGGDEEGGNHIEKEVGTVGEEVKNLENLQHLRCCSPES